MVSRRGFTVIEMVMVIVIIAICAAYAITRVNRGQYRVDDSARNTRITLQAAQRLAVTSQFNVIVSFDTLRQQIRIVDDTNDNNIVDAGEHVTWHSLDAGIVFAAPPSSGGVTGTASTSVDGTNILSINGMPSVVFMRSGSASGYTEIYLADQGHTVTNYRAIQVTQSTGRTSWYRLSTVSNWVKASL